MTTTKNVVACQPENPWLAFTARIQQVRPETPGVATYNLVFDAPALADGFCFRPGQFNMLYAPGVGEAAISISGDPGDRAKIVHTIRAYGAVTSRMMTLRAGDVVGIRAER